MIKFLTSATCILVVLGLVQGHGRLRVPYSRSTLWRYADQPEIQPYADIIEANYNDNELFCGGANYFSPTNCRDFFGKGSRDSRSRKSSDVVLKKSNLFLHYQQNLGGKCGVCGDPYDAIEKDNEAGGKYAKGIIVAQYLPGSKITVNVELTAHHLGYFEFRLCPWNNTLVPITHECLDQYVLKNDGPESPKWYPPSLGGSSQMFYVDLYLPNGLECDQCVLQWKYHAGNTFNCDDDGHCCTGCGHQEEFYGCADIAIGTGPTLPPPSFTGSTTSAATKPTETTTTTTKPTTSTTTTSTVVSQSSTTPGDSGECWGQPGSHKHDCDTFFTCLGSTPIYYDCPPGTVFDEVRDLCDYAANVEPPCGEKMK